MSSASEADSGQLQGDLQMTCSSKVGTEQHPIYYCRSSASQAESGQRNSEFTEFTAAQCLIYHYCRSSASQTESGQRQGDLGALGGRDRDGDKVKRDWLDSSSNEGKASKASSKASKASRKASTAGWTRPQMKARELMLCTNPHKQKLVVKLVKLVVKLVQLNGLFLK